HGVTRGDGHPMDVAPVQNGLRVLAFDGASPLLLLAQGAAAQPAHTWYRNFDLPRERERGLEATEDHLHAGTFATTLASGEGLTLVTGRPDVTRRVLATFARFVDRGLLPNRFPEAGEAPEYNTVDATLWYVEAVRAYHAATGDDGLLEALYPGLEEIVRWHREGTRYGIKEDPTDGLLTAGAPGVQLTWMDAKAGDRIVTPRRGKAIEINALWYNALHAMRG